MESIFFTNTFYETCQIDPSTPLSKLVRFRERYPAEVARYRSALQAPASNPELLQALVHNDEGRLRDWYKIEVDMPLSEIRDALRGIGVNCIIEQALKISALSTPASGLAIAAGAPPVIALGGQVVLSLASSFLKVREDRKKAFSGKPYAYLYRLQHQFGR
jgi:hypothetical protein